MVKYIALYPGQGGQEGGMALDLYKISSQVRDLFDLFSQRGKLDLKKILEVGDPNQLGETVVTHLAITLANLSATLVARQLQLPLACHAGFSLGELSAYHASGVLTTPTLIDLLVMRATLLRDYTLALERGGSKLSMAAVVGLSFEKAHQILEKSGVKELYCANDNSFEQVVLSGLDRELEKVEEQLREGGAKRIVKLKVNGAFHTPLMGGAQREFSQFLKELPFKSPSAQLYSSVTAEVVANREEARELLARQLTAPVRWRSLVERFNGRPALELGPGRVLTRLYGEGCRPAGSYLELLQVREGVEDV